ncbi:HD domain-containing protein [Patescibacteria group bacterium]|nr:HD domain-containing protein [Patescibacteria group bacterium]MBU1473066.1 HD domain-containing protein [Patescibacteria group bacterium]MBU2460178.1 HD domain-containing protein [Patescibacteria group bacterium]MBU2544494.1 HD domain-containing protein [Patescibacteria group bacterium]
MIPTEDQCRQLWEKYHLPEKKRRHVELVACVARFLSQQLTINNSQLTINHSLLVAGALLHDIDSKVPKLSGEKHPDAGVRVLKIEGLAKIAQLIKTHALHTILDRHSCPKTLEEKILFLADKMVKYDIITVDERFRLWGNESLSDAEQRVLRAAYPKVKALEKELLYLAGIGSPGQVAKLIMEEYTNKKKEGV